LTIFGLANAEYTCGTQKWVPLLIRPTPLAPGDYNRVVAAKVFLGTVVHRHAAEILAAQPAISRGFLGASTQSLKEEIMASQPPIFFIKRVTRWASSDSGDMIQLETIIDGGSALILRAEYRNVSRLTQAILQAARIAEQKQKAIPNQDIQLVSPWAAVGMESGLSTGGKLVGVLYRTTEGVPIELTMSPELAHETIQRLQSELDKLALGQYPKMS
jgi:hypothetical protein